MLAICLIDVPDDIARERLFGRSQRTDIVEDEAYVAKRLVGFQENVVPTINELSGDYPVIKIDGTQPPEAVAHDLAGVITARTPHA